MSSSLHRPWRLFSLVLVSVIACNASAPAQQPPPGTEAPAASGPTSDSSPPPAGAASATAAATAGQDAFGVTQLYPSKPGGETWSLPTNALKDSRFAPQQSITPNADGSWKMKGKQVRMEVLTSSGYDSQRIPTYDPDVLASRGYMQDAHDWKNIEMTGFVRLNATSDPSDNFSWYARGGLHTDSQPCEGTSYKGGLTYQGQARWEKESWHVSYAQTPYQTVTTPLLGRWVGFKAVMRNTSSKGQPAVKLELWLNDSADRVTWKKIYDFTDAGQLGGDTRHCGGGVDGMPLTWGGPIATFRWDSATDVDFKWLSVRELAD